MPEQIILAITGLITALTPIILLFMNNRQRKVDRRKAKRLEEMHAEVMNKRHI